MPGGGQGDDIRPGLIDLFNDVQSVTLDRIKPGHLEFHTPEQVSGSPVCAAIQAWILAAASRIRPM
jgi:hypothetical protein